MLFERVTLEKGDLIVVSNPEDSQLPTMKKTGYELISDNVLLKVYEKYRVSHHNEVSLLVAELRRRNINIKT